MALYGVYIVEPYYPCPVDVHSLLRRTLGRRFRWDLQFDCFAKHDLLWIGIRV